MPDDAVFFQPTLEPIRVLPRYAVEPALLDGVQRNEIHMAQHALQPLRERLCVRFGIVDPADQRVFEYDAPSRALRIRVCSFEHLLDRVRLVDRHDGTSHLVAVRMQRDRKRHVRRIVDERIDLRHEPAGGKRNVARADVRSRRTRHALQKRYDVVVIVERLAAAHQHDVRDRALPIGRRFVALDLGKEGQHLAGTERAHTALQRACAELASHVAADLRRQADRVAVAVAHQNAFDEVSVLQLKEVLDRAVLFGHALVEDARAAEGDGGELFSEVLRQIRHVLGTDALFQPVAHLRGAEFRHAESTDGVGDLLFGHVHPIHAQSSSRTA